MPAIEIDISEEILSNYKSGLLGIGKLKFFQEGA